jgi:hypothetical protein
MRPEGEEKYDGMAIDKGSTRREDARGEVGSRGVRGERVSDGRERGES